MNVDPTRTTGPLAAIGRGYGHFVAAVAARPGLAAILVLLVLLPGAYLDAQYFANVRTGLEDLLPKDAPSVRALDVIDAHLGGQSHLTVIVQSTDVEPTTASSTTSARA